MTDFPERAKRVGAIANENAEAGDKDGKLADAVVAALHKEGLYGMWVPRVLGGAELDPIESLQVIENVAYGDPSTGWVLMAAALAIGTGAAYLGDAAIQELFGGDRFPVIAGQGTRPGTGRPGKWWLSIERFMEFRIRNQTRYAHSYSRHYRRHR
jgi:alkylation response protein AidB-like acyl-CoA dehydrogenase